MNSYWVQVGIAKALSTIGGHSQVICIGQNGVESVLAPCLPTDLAKKVASSFNRSSPHRAVLRSIVLPNLSKLCPSYRSPRPNHRTAHH